MKDTFTLLFDDDTSIDLFDNEYFETTAISGLTNYKANLHKHRLATIPGDTVTGRDIEPRDLIVSFQPKQGNIFSVENAVRSILNPARISYGADFIWQKSLSNGTTLDLSAKVEFEYIEMPRFGDPLDGEIGLHMPYPFFISDDRKSVNLSDANNYSATIGNNGDDEIGATLAVRFSGNINNLIIANAATGNYMKLREISYAGQGYDIIDIDTRKGKKSITQRSTGLSLINDYDLQSKWLVLVPGENAITATFDAGNNAEINRIVIAYSEVFV